MSGYLCLGCCPCDPVLDKTGEDKIRCDYTIAKKHPHISLRREDHGPVVRRASLAIALRPPASPGLPVHFLLLDRKTHNGNSDHSISRDPPDDTVSVEKWAIPTCLSSGSLESNEDKVRS